MPNDRWDEVAEVCRVLLADRAAFDEKERSYKLRIAEHVQLVVAAVRDGVDLTRPLRRAFGPPNNLTPWRQHAGFTEWAGQQPDDARSALRELLLGAAEPGARIDRFLQLVPRALLPTPGIKLNIASFFLMGAEPQTLPVFKPTPFGVVESRLGEAPDVSGLTLGAAYERHLAFARRLLDELRGRDVPALDMLDAQSLIWVLSRSDEPICVVWRREGSAGVRDAETARPVVPPSAIAGPLREDEESVETLARDLLIEPSFLTDVIGLLREKKQIVLYGPPGTGKTFLARRLQEHLTSTPSASETVQFHPSYSYEDFVQGYRPVVGADGHMVYRLKDGPLVRLAGRAASSPENHVLLIDEINRGNLPRILGELLFLLEYRDEEVALMYAEEGTRFTLPSNLLIIATMNTVDRSIGVVDAALRRRFHFVSLFPDEPPISALLRRWLTRERPQMLFVADVMDRLNRELRARFGRHVQLGPSYFMKSGLSEDALRRIWAHDVMPFLEEQFFDHEEELASLSLDRLRQEPDADPPA